MDFIEIARAIKRKENLITLRKEVNQKWVTDKLVNHLERNPHLNISLEDFRDVLKFNDLLASYIAKDPSKQNISENIIAEGISDLSEVKLFVNHASSVNLFIVEGEPTDKRIDGVKSVDFSWTTNDKKIFATQKYTKGIGGHQDNQFNDVISFLQNCQGESDNIYIAIVDGSHYTKSKINTLKKYEAENIKVCNYVELSGVLKLIKNN